MQQEQNNPINKGEVLHTLPELHSFRSIKTSNKKRGKQTSIKNPVFNGKPDLK
ncbi:hypothetical protein J7J00_24200 [Bacillus sp. ISL-4]|uniref:hypothetical protein n=1 Tax=Bacillus sp. ISL-4 TaxID=2819125 RepID=UPI001BE5893C|nr:hypothetical protein [Bacillus sp. ISL-4]MBT2668538.1 hypothetical protein [Bacillus sp. ISL-4]MBT2674538.1 hypothetical protein [Streptomyces sp. ISL-14]